VVSNLNPIKKRCLRGNSHEEVGERKGSRFRVMVVDEFCRHAGKLIPQLLQGDQSIEVVGTAMHGVEDLKKIGDCILCRELELWRGRGRMDGMEMLRKIVRRSILYHILYILVSSNNDEMGRLFGLNAMAFGAVIFVASQEGREGAE